MNRPMIMITNIKMKMTTNNQEAEGYLNIHDDLNKWSYFTEHAYSQRIFYEVLGSKEQDSS